VARGALGGAGGARAPRGRGLNESFFMHGRRKLYLCACGTIMRMDGPATMACPRCGARAPLEHGVMWTTTVERGPPAPRIPPRAMAADATVARRVVACPACRAVGPCVVLACGPVGAPRLGCPRCDHVWDPSRDHGFAARPAAAGEAAAAAAAFASPR